MPTSAPPLNSVSLVGHLTADPELRSLSDGRSVCDMRLAVNDRAQKPLYVDVTTFGAGAESCARYLSKGRSVAVTGRLVYREWEAENGARRSKHQVVGQVSFGGRPAGAPADREAPQDGDSSSSDEEIAL